MTYSQMISKLVGPGRKMTRSGWGAKHYIYYGCLPNDVKKEYPSIIKVNNNRHTIFRHTEEDLKSVDWRLI